MKDQRLDWLPLDASFYRCPVTGCEETDLLTCLIRNRKGRQRAVWACAEHLPVEVEAATNHLRQVTNSPPL